MCWRAAKPLAACFAPQWVLLEQRSIFCSFAKRDDWPAIIFNITDLNIAL
jgi:hypothetical protein